MVEQLHRVLIENTFRDCHGERCITDSQRRTETLDGAVKLDAAIALKAVYNFGPCESVSASLFRAEFIAQRKFIITPGSEIQLKLYL